MEELDMDEEARPEFACPYCYEDHDITSLRVHLEESHTQRDHETRGRRGCWLRT